MCVGDDSEKRWPVVKRVVIKVAAMIHHDVKFVGQILN